MPEICRVLGIVIGMF
jgi:hypothetical protein